MLTPRVAWGGLKGGTRFYMLSTGLQFSHQFQPIQRNMTHKHTPNIPFNPLFRDLDKKMILSLYFPPAINPSSVQHWPKSSITNPNYKKAQDVLNRAWNQYVNKIQKKLTK